MQHLDSNFNLHVCLEKECKTITLIQGRRRRSGKPASAGPLFWPNMLSAVSLFLVSAHFTFYSDFIQSAKIY